MYYDSQNYQNGQQQQTTPAPAYKYVTGGGNSDVALGMPTASPVMGYKEVPR